MGHPKKIHWQTVKWIIYYLRGTINVGLMYDWSLDTCSSIVGYVDSDYVSDLDRMRSLTGYIFTLSGYSISWKVTLQSTIVLFILEIRYMIAAEVVREAIWL